MAFSVGQKVEYIGGANINPEAVGQGIPIPTVKTPYTVSNVFLTHLGKEHIELVELPFSRTATLYEGFNAEIFRPLTDTKSSISFTEGAPLDTQHLDNRRKLPAKVSS